MDGIDECGNSKNQQDIGDVAPDDVTDRDVRSSLKCSFQSDHKLRSGGAKSDHHEANQKR